MINNNHQQRATDVHSALQCKQESSPPSTQHRGGTEIGGRMCVGFRLGSQSCSTGPKSTWKKVGLEGDRWHYIVKSSAQCAKLGLL